MRGGGGVRRGGEKIRLIRVEGLRPWRPLALEAAYVPLDAPAWAAGGEGEKRAGGVGTIGSGSRNSDIPLYVLMYFFHPHTKGFL